MKRTCVLICGHQRSGLLGEMVTLSPLWKGVEFQEGELVSALKSKGKKQTEFLGPLKRKDKEVMLIKHPLYARFDRSHILHLI